MNIAIFEPSPRICGAVTWALEVARGLRSIGCDVTQIAASKSGRALKSWSGPGSWVPVSAREFRATLSKFDGLVLSDVACRSRDVTEDVPWYIEEIDRAGTWWTSMVHDDCYPKRVHDAINALLQTSTFSGCLVTTRVRETAPFIDSICGLFGPRVEWVVDPYLPFNFDRATTAISDERSVIMTSRIMSNKGQDVLLDIIPGLCNAEVWGYSSHGFPSCAWQIWEAALANGYEPVLEPITFSDATHPDAKKFTTGRFSLRHVATGVVYNYRGAFATTADVAWVAPLHLSLTNDSLRGTIEYASLDGALHGAIVVVPEHAVEYTEYETLITIPYRNKKSINLDGCIEVIGGVLRSSSLDRRLTANLQRRELRRLHDPRRVAGSIVEIFE